MWNNINNLKQDVPKTNTEIEENPLKKVFKLL